MKDHSPEDVLILAIESSCDETAAAVVKNGRTVCSNVISSRRSAPKPDLPHPAPTGRRKEEGEPSSNQKPLTEKARLAILSYGKVKTWEKHLLAESLPRKGSLQFDY